MSYSNVSFPLFTMIDGINNTHLHKPGEVHEVISPEGDRYDVLLVASQKIRVSEIPDLLLAFTFNTKSRSDSLEMLEESVELYADDCLVTILVFLRPELTKQFVINGPKEAIDT